METTVDNAILAALDEAFQIGFKTAMWDLSERFSLQLSPEFVNDRAVEKMPVNRCNLSGACACDDFGPHQAHVISAFRKAYGHRP